MMTCETCGGSGFITRKLKYVKTEVDRRIWTGESGREYLTDVTNLELQKVGGDDICPSCLTRSEIEYDTYKNYQERIDNE